MGSGARSRALNSRDSGRRSQQKPELRTEAGRTAPLGRDLLRASGTPLRVAPLPSLHRDRKAASADCGSVATICKRRSDPSLHCGLNAPPTASQSFVPGRVTGSVISRPRTCSDESCKTTAGRTRSGACSIYCGLNSALWAVSQAFVSGRAISDANQMLMLLANAD